MNAKTEKINWGSFTPFQKRVYRAVRAIPSGQVRSYSWVAEKTGNPAARRAVGRVLSRNPYPVLIPCHRVIRKDGGWGGFSRGEKEKIRLIRKEGRKDV